MKLDIIRKVEALELRCAALAKKANLLALENRRLGKVNKGLRAQNRLLKKALDSN